MKERRVDVSSVEVGASMVDGGAQAMEAALRALLGFALFETRDTLPDDAMERLMERIRAFGVV
jgi:hypothetical protein